MIRLFFEKLSRNMFKPYLFWTQSKKEKSFKQVLSYFGVLALFISILFFAVELRKGSFLNLALFLGVFVFIALIVASFVYSFLFYISSKIFKLKLNFLQAYKLSAYSLTPQVLFYLIPIIGPLFVIYTIIIKAMGMKTFFKISDAKIVGIIFLTYVFLFLLALLFSFIWIFLMIGY